MISLRVLIVLFVVSISTTARAGTLAQFRLIGLPAPLGEIDVELFDQDKPVTVQNFINLVKTTAFTNSFLHRVIPNFIVQGGGFRVVNPQDNSLFQSWVPVPNFGTITNEYNVGPRISNLYGTIAMARVGGQVNSATSQWFFNMRDNASNLDQQNGGFTVFGRVVNGTNTLNYFNTISKHAGIVDLTEYYASGADLYTDLPVAYVGNTPPKYTQLIYVDITLLQVHVQNILGGRQISWNSVAGKPNVVEYTSVLPPVWQNLVTVTGNGGQMQTLDTFPRASSRFYRVRVVY